jgi:hypothetical protein
MNSASGPRRRGGRLHSPHPRVTRQEHPDRLHPAHRQVQGRHGGLPREPEDSGHGNGPEDLAPGSEAVDAGFRKDQWVR